jgi:hypothetical protein
MNTGFTLEKSLPCMIAAVPLLISGAAEARTTLDIEGAATGRVASNPYLVQGTDRSAASIELSLTPRVTINEAEGSISLQGTVRHSEFTRNYPASDAVTATATGDWRLDPRTRATANLGFDESIAGETGNFVRDPSAGAVIDDFTLSGLRVRRRLIQSGLGVSHQPDARQNVSLNVFASSTRVLGSRQGLTTGSYATYGGAFAYSRTLSERATVGFSVNSLRYECRSGPACSTFIVQPELTGSLVLARLWTLEGSAGVSIARQRFAPLNDAQTTVSASGSLSLCRKGTRTDFCLTGRREVEPTSGNGAQSTTSLSSYWRYRLSERDSISADVGYADSSGEQLRSLGAGGFRYLNARLTGTRQLGPRLFLNLQAGYANSSSPLVGERANIDGAIGLSFSLGRR